MKNFISFFYIYQEKETIVKLALIEAMFQIQPKTIKRKFTKEEDQEIIKQVEIFGPKSWELISRFIPNRSAKQCRDRYQNYLAKNVFYGEWTKEEDNIILQKLNEFGNQWSILSKFLKNRTPNAIKNRASFLIKNSEKICPTEINKKDINVNKIQESNHIIFPPIPSEYITPNMLILNLC